MKHHNVYYYFLIILFFSSCLSKEAKNKKMVKHIRQEFKENYFRYIKTLEFIKRNKIDTLDCTILYLPKPSDFLIESIDENGRYEKEVELIKEERKKLVSILFRGNMNMSLAIDTVSVFFMGGALESVRLRYQQSISLVYCKKEFNKLYPSYAYYEGEQLPINDQKWIYKLEPNWYILLSDYEKHPWGIDF